MDAEPLAAGPGGERLPAPAIAFALLFPTAFTLCYFVALAGRPPAVVQAVYAGGKLLQFGFPLACTLAVTGALPRVRWPGARGAAGGLLFGVVLYGAALALYAAVLRPGGALDGPAEAIRTRVAGLGVGTPWRFAALAAFYSLVHAAAEEYYWRWFVFGALRAPLGAARAVAASSAGFAAHHVVILAVFFGWASPWTYALAAAVGAGGAFWAWLYRRSGSLLGP